MDQNTKHILEIVTNIQEKMATKEELSAVEDRLSSVESRLSSVEDELQNMRVSLQAQIHENTQAIAELSEQMRSVLGYAKEIDMLMARVAKLEKHLGIA